MVRDDSNETKTTANRSNDICPVCKGEGEIIQITRNRKKQAVKIKCRYCDGEGKRKEENQ